MEDQRVDGRILLKGIINKQCLRIRIGFIRQKTKVLWRFLLNIIMKFRFP
jgi:hypothetical protein